MAKKVTGYVKLQIAAGKATPAPPGGPALGQAHIGFLPVRTAALGAPLFAWLLLSVLGFALPKPCSTAGPSTATVTARVGERTLFLAEARQAGIFALRGVPPEELASRFKFARQKSKLAGTIRGSYFVIKGEY